MRSFPQIPAPSATKVMKEEQINKIIKDEKLDTNKISDGYHTFKELYEHRIALFISLCSQLNSAAEELGKERVVWKSKIHSDGTSWEGWFMLGIFKEKGKQISYHLPNDYWD